jgi:hypothetical protein
MLLQMMQRQAEAAAAAQAAAAAAAAAAQLQQQAAASQALIQQLVQQNQAFMQSMERERSRSRSTGRDSAAGSSRGRAATRDRTPGRSVSPWARQGGGKGGGSSSTGKGYGSNRGHGQQGGGPRHGSSERRQDDGKGEKGGKGRRHRFGGETWIEPKGGWEQSDVGYFTGSRKNTRPSERFLDSDDESDVESCRLRFSAVLPRGRGKLAEIFDQVSAAIMRGNWHECARLLNDYPDVCAMQVPHNANVAAGYGLIHTMCTKSTPDNLTDWVLNRTPWAILSTGGHKRSRRQTGIISPAPAGSRISLEFKIGARP